MLYYLIVLYQFNIAYLLNQTKCMKERRTVGNNRQEQHIEGQIGKKHEANFVIFEDQLRDYAELSVRSNITIISPHQTYIQKGAQIGDDSTIFPFVFIGPGVRVGRHCIIEPHVHLEDQVFIGDGSIIRSFSRLKGNVHIGNNSVVGVHVSLENVVVGDNCSIAYHAELRNCEVSDGAHIEHMQMKRTKFGRSKAMHIGYLGDAVIGNGVNIGAGTITCNFDGAKKNMTVIKDEVFTGSGNMLIAPVTLEKGAYTAAGSTITKDVPENSLAIGRSEQVNKIDWVLKRKAKEKK